MAAMRVYLGSDHGGYELKQAIVDHLREGGHEPIDCGAYAYDAEDDYPAFCIAAALKTVADPGSLGIVLGGSGNGEQIAANKVPGARCALGVEPGDGIACAPTQQRPTDRYRRADAHRRGGAGDRRCLRLDSVVGRASPSTARRHHGRLRTNWCRAAGAGRASLTYPDEDDGPRQRRRPSSDFERMG